MQLRHGHGPGGDPGGFGNRDGAGIGGNAQRPPVDHPRLEDFHNAFAHQHLHRRGLQAAHVKLVPTTLTLVSPAPTMKGRARFLATSNSASPCTSSTARSLSE